MHLLLSGQTLALRDPQGCGLLKDCPRRYNLSSVLASAAAWDPQDSPAAAELEARKSAAREACRRRGRIRTGGWCTGVARLAVGAVSLPNGQSYSLPQNHVEADAIVVDVLHRLLNQGSRRQSVNDFGAGVGQYGRALRSLDPETRWRGYDGAGDVDEATGGFVRFFDLTIPLSLPRADWVLSLEVGEHVPSAHEAMLIRNLHAHNCRGIVLSWASLWQSGHRHVNNHSPRYLEEIFEGLGYRARPDLEREIRNPRVRLSTPADARPTMLRRGRPPGAPPLLGPINDYFAKNAHVFERVRALEGC